MKKLLGRTRRAVLNWVPARWAAILLHVFHHRRIPNLSKPKRFSDRLLVRKRASNDERYAQLSDKLAVKEVIATHIGNDWIIETLWEGQEITKVPKFSFPYVIKSTMGSGGNLFVWDPSRPPTEKELLQFAAANRGYPKYFHETWYDKNAKKFLVEKIHFERGKALLDYKLFCFNGKVKLIQVDTGRFVDHRRALFDSKWNWLDVSLKYPVPNDPPDPPKHLRSMIEAAESLSADFDFVRVDLYETEEGPKFGEFTFCPGSGLERFSPDDFEVTLGKEWTS